MSIKASPKKNTPKISLPKPVGDPSSERKGLTQKEINDITHTIHRVKDPKPDPLLAELKKASKTEPKKKAELPKALAKEDKPAVKMDLYRKATGKKPTKALASDSPKPKLDRAALRNTTKGGKAAKSAQVCGPSGGFLQGAIRDIIKSPRKFSQLLNRVFDGTDGTGGSDLQKFKGFMQNLGKTLADECNAGRPQATRVAIEALQNKLKTMLKGLDGKGLSGEAVAKLQNLMGAVGQLKGPGAATAKALLAQAVAKVVNKQWDPKATTLTNDNQVAYGNNQAVKKLSKAMAGMISTQPAAVYNALRHVDVSRGDSVKGGLATGINHALLKTPEGQKSLARSLGALTARSVEPYGGKKMSAAEKQKRAAELGYFMGTTAVAIQRLRGDEKSKLKAVKGFVDNIGTALAALPLPSYLSTALQTALKTVSDKWRKNASKGVDKKINGLLRSLATVPQAAFDALRGPQSGPNRPSNNQMHEYVHNVHSELGLYWRGFQDQK